MIKQFYLNRVHMLDRLIDIPQGKTVTAYVSPRLSADRSAGVFQSIPVSAAVLKEITEVYTGSPNGAVIFWGEQKKELIIPPFPIRDSAILEGYEPEHLKTMLGRDYVTGMVLIRLGAYGIGICKGDKLISSKVGTGLVHGRHRQGGSSSRRFERHRDKQMETFFNRVCGHVNEQFEPFAKSIDYLVYGGAWETIQLFIKYCPFLGKLNKPVLPALSDTPEPRRAVLEKAAGRIYSSQVYEWEEQENS